MRRKKRMRGRRVELTGSEVALALRWARQWRTPVLRRRRPHRTKAWTRPKQRLLLPRLRAVSSPFRPQPRPPRQRRRGSATRPQPRRPASLVHRLNPSPPPQSLALRLELNPPRPSLVLHLEPNPPPQSLVLRLDPNPPRPSLETCRRRRSH